MIVYIFVIKFELIKMQCLLLRQGCFWVFSTTSRFAINFHMIFCRGGHDLNILSHNFDYTNMSHTWITTNYYLGGRHRCHHMIKLERGGPSWPSCPPPPSPWPLISLIKWFKKGGRTIVYVECSSFITLLYARVLHHGAKNFGSIMSHLWLVILAKWTIFNMNNVQLCKSNLVVGLLSPNNNSKFQSNLCTILPCGVWHQLSRSQ